MAVQIIRHDPPTHQDDDPDHAIPSLAVIDVAAYLKGGGAHLSIVIATALTAEEASLDRLQNKIEGYLEHIKSDDFRADAGSHHSGNVVIRVVIHPDSAPEIYDFLQRAGDWVLANGATLEVVDLDLTVH